MMTGVLAAAAALPAQVDPVRDPTLPPTWAVLVDDTPVPTRVETSVYGEGAGNSERLSCVLDAWLGETRIAIYGGTPGSNAFLLVAPADGYLPTPWGTVLVGRGFVPIAGVFDNQGCMFVPVDFANTALARRDFFAQAIEYRFGDYDLSAGLRMRVAPGNRQPALGYAGPKLAAVLFKDVSNQRPTMYFVQTAFAVPAANYRLTVLGADNANGVTRVEIALEQPTQPVGGPTTLREYIQLPLFPARTIEIWVVEHPPGVPACMTLAAAIDRDF
jgi:hypothetical protein